MYKHILGSLALCASLVLGGSLRAEAQLTPGTILVVDRGDMDRGLLFAVDPNTGNRTVINDFSNPSQGPLGIDPISVDVAADGAIVVADTSADPGGNIPDFPGLIIPGAGAVFAINPITGNRTVVTDFFNTGQGPGQNPQSIAVAPDGTILVIAPVTTGAGSVVEVDPVDGNRTELSNFANAAQGPTSILVTDVFVKSDGTILVPDTNAGSIGGNGGRVFMVDALSGSRTVVSDLANAGQGPLGGGPNAVGARSDGTIIVLDALSPLFDMLFLVDMATGNRTLLSDASNAGQGPTFTQATRLVAGPNGTTFVIDPTGGTGNNGALYVVDSAGNRTTLSDFGDASQGPLGVAPWDLAALPSDDDELPTCTLESPAVGSNTSGVLPYFGFCCEVAKASLVVEAMFNDNPAAQIGSGLSRLDTAGECNNDGNNGFMGFINYNLLPPGPNQLKILVNGQIVAGPVTFNNVPWADGSQFIPQAPAGNANALTAKMEGDCTLESPGPSGLTAGVSPYFGFCCEGAGEPAVIEAMFNGNQASQIASGLSRFDTANECGNDGNNGFMGFINYNFLPAGQNEIKILRNGQIVLGPITFNNVPWADGTEFFPLGSGGPGLSVYTLLPGPRPGEASMLGFVPAQQGWVVQATRTADSLSGHDVVLADILTLNEIRTGTGGNEMVYPVPANAGISVSSGGAFIDLGNGVFVGQTEAIINSDFLSPFHANVALVDGPNLKFFLLNTDSGQAFEDILPGSLSGYPSAGTTAGTFATLVNPVPDTPRGYEKRASNVNSMVVLPLSAESPKADFVANAPANSTIVTVPGPGSTSSQLQYQQSRQGYGMVATGVQ